MIRGSEGILILMLWNLSSGRLIGKNWTKEGLEEIERWMANFDEKEEGERGRKRKKKESSRGIYKVVHASRVEGRTNSCYFTCSIYYLNASPAAMSRYREISGQTFPAFTKIPRIASNFLPRTRKICRG